jgi:hypothetical protein
VWAGVAAGLVVLAPHGYWLLTDGRSALAYAADNLTQGEGILSHIKYPLKYTVIQLIFLCPALVLVWRWGRRDRLGTRNPPDDLDAGFLFWHGPVLGLLPAGLSLASGMSLGSMWGIATWGLLPAWAVARFGLRPRRPRVRRALLAALALTGVYVVSALADGLFLARQLDYKAAVAAVREAWYARYEAPLTIAGGYGRYYEGLAVYAPEAPDVFGGLRPDTHRRVTPERLAREGAVLVIPAALTEAVAQARERFPIDAEVRVSLPERRQRLFRTRADELVVLFVAPRSGQAPASGPGPQSAGEAPDPG